MAVYTDVSDEELEAFIASYDIGALTSFKGIAEGVENSNYLVHTESGPYILTLYEKRVRPEDLPYFLALMEHLAARGITCPLPVKDRKGQALKQLAGRPAALITFLEGLWVRRPGIEHCAGLGEALARFHLAGADFPMSRANSLALAGWRALYASIGERRDRVTPTLAAEIEKELALSRSALAGRSSRGRDPCRPLPRQRVLPRRQGLGADRLLFRLQRHPRLRRRHLPQCLVLRDRCELQRHQGARDAAGL